jgi:hypothetical protein
MKTIESIDVPQANRLNRVCDLVALVDSGLEDKLGLTRELGLVPREIEYYKHAARILGFAEIEEGRFSITELGHTFLKVRTPEEKRRVLAKAIEDAVVFADLFADCGSSRPKKGQIVSFLLDRTILNKTTAARRADTILAWLKAIDAKKV